MRRAIVVCLSGALALGTASQALGGEDPAPVCTEIGCSSGMTVNVKRLPDDARRVRICVAGRCGSSQKIYRDDADGSYVSATLPKFKRRAGARVRVSVQLLDADGSVIDRARRRARVKRFQPNGSDCPPVCFHAGLVYRGDTGRLS